MVSTNQILEFTKIKDKLSEYACTKEAKVKAEKLIPFLSESEVESSLKETTEARWILDKFGTPPLTSLDDIGEYMEIAKKGGCLTEEQLEQIAIHLGSIKRMKDFLNRSKQLEVRLSYYEENLDSLEEVREEIHRMIRNSKVDDFATSYLKNTRSGIERLENKMHTKANELLRRQSKYMSDTFCTTRNGRICLPVKKEYKFQVAGSVIDKSATGSTLFIEPTTVAKYSEELSLLRIEEENEVRKILYQLTGMFAEQEEVFYQNKKTMEKLDYIFAKGKLSLEYNGIEPQINTKRRISIRNGRHPLMERGRSIPLNFKIGNGIEGIIITGPNTGGKTVAIKTVGLHCIMAQTGLHIPCEEADICLNNQVLCDIGDGQNISENLSTFSAHITNIMSILRKVDKESLVILDELGSGTDPTEGMGIAIAVLEELRNSGCLFLVTTHYPEVKNYGEQTQGVLNARMKFDPETLSPLYQLEIGKAGESCAFSIAKKLGMPEGMLSKAREAAYGETKSHKKDQQEQTWKLTKETTPKLHKKQESRKKASNKRKYQIGDSVMVYPKKKIGIVCETEDEKGNVCVQVQGAKEWINHRRLKLQVKSEELYPADYDFSIIFETVENRKAHHQMMRKYVQDIERKK